MLFRSTSPPTWPPAAPSEMLLHAILKPHERFSDAIRYQPERAIAEAEEAALLARPPIEMRGLLAMIRRNHQDAQRKAARLPTAEVVDVRRGIRRLGHR